MIDIKCGDCLKFINDLPSESIDLIVTDPPYKVTSRGCTGNMSGYWTSNIAKSGKIFEYNDISPYICLSSITY